MKKLFAAAGFLALLVPLRAEEKQTEEAALAELKSLAGRPDPKKTIDLDSEELKELMGKQDITAEYLEPRVGDVRHSLADITMARELLGYESKVDLREGLQRTIDWFNR